MENYLIKTENIDDKTIVTFSGDLSIQNIEKIKQELINIIVDYPNININLDDVSDIDVSFVQLLYAFRQEKQQQNKEIAIEVNLNEELRCLLSKAGINFK